MLHKLELKYPSAASGNSVKTLYLILFNIFKNKILFTHQFLIKLKFSIIHKEISRRLVRHLKLSKVQLRDYFYVNSKLLTSLRS